MVETGRGRGWKRHKEQPTMNPAAYKCLVTTSPRRALHRVKAGHLCGQEEITQLLLSGRTSQASDHGDTRTLAGPGTLATSQGRYLQSLPTLLLLLMKPRKEKQRRQKHLQSQASVTSPVVRDDWQVQVVAGGQGGGSRFLQCCNLC